MPVKQLRGFLRRKSAGNALETFENEPPSPSEPTSSFRVLSRTDGADATAGFVRLNQHARTTASRPKSSPDQAWRKDSYDESQVLNNRTNNSSSTGDISYSDRNSYQSTKPSSLDSKYEDDLNVRRKALRSSEDVDGQVGDREQIKRDRASFTASLLTPRPRLVNSNNSPPRRNGEVEDLGRDRSTTASSIASSASTAMPQQVDFAFGFTSGSPSASQSWFDNTQSGRRPMTEEPMNIERGIQTPLPPQPAARSESDSMLATKKQFSWEERQEKDYRPAPLSSHLDKSPAPDSGTRRRSWESDESEKAFLSRGSQRNTPDTEKFSSQPYSPTYAPHSTQSTNLQKHISHDSQDSTSFAATDNQGLLDAAWASQALEARYGRKEEPRRPERSSPANEVYQGQWAPNQRIPLSRPGISLQSSSTTTPRAARDYDEEAPLFDDRGSFSPDTDASKARASTMLKTDKVMTPAEFEKYKRTAAERSDEDAESQKSDDSDAYEDEDETERHKQIMKQRRKQEAHLAVYRQQMMKVTGEQPSDLPFAPGRPELPRTSRSLPTLDPRSTDLGVGKTSDDDDDDEVPLGVLQAHGFPSRSRPPTRLSASSSALPRPTSQLSAYPAPLNATRNEQTAGGGGDTSLPPFARNLPQDPYVGASLVNQANRESMQQSTYRPAGLPPGGLVGVIAGEERARAMRRGSPNVNGTYGYSMPQQHSMPSLPSLQVPHHGMPPTAMGMPFTPLQQQSMMNGELPQADMNNMMQMMQVQMQWMQQMQQMMGMPAMMPGQMMSQGAPSEVGTHNPSNFLSPLPFQQPNQRASAPSSAFNFDPYQQRVSGSRAPSVMGNLPANYAPSVAPSERSNVGQPSRYRPVTPANVISNTRTHTMSSTNQLNNPRSRSPLTTQARPTHERESRSWRGDCTVDNPSSEQTQEGHRRYERW